MVCGPRFHYSDLKLYRCVADGGDGLQIWRVVANMLNKEWQGAGGPSVWGLGKGLTTPYRKKGARCDMLRRASKLAGSCEHGNEPSGSIKGGEFID
jgi:hypothetical protein